MQIVDAMSLAYLGLLAGTFGFRVLRDWHSRRFRSVRITYPGGRIVTVPPGFSVLEDQQFAGALMWTCVTLIYLVPAAILSTRLLSPRIV